MSCMDIVWTSVNCPGSGCGRTDTCHQGCRHGSLSGHFEGYPVWYHAPGNAFQLSVSLR